MVDDLQAFEIPPCLRFEESSPSDRAGIACPLWLPNEYEIRLTQISGTKFCYGITKCEILIIPVTIMLAAPVGMSCV